MFLQVSVMSGSGGERRRRLARQIHAQKSSGRSFRIEKETSGRFGAEVIDARNQDGYWIVPRSWSVPRLDGSSVSSKEIPMFGGPRLDFAYFDFRLPRTSGRSRRDQVAHWRSLGLPPLPQPVKVRYSAVATGLS